MIVKTRIQDPRRIDIAALRGAVARGTMPVVQFSTSKSYSKALLRSLDSACADLGDLLEVRFFGHYGESFDAAALDHLPHIARLTIDCLTRIDHPDRLSLLERLTHLSFDVYEFDQPDFLSTLTPALRTLVLSPTRKPSVFDLRHLKNFLQLEELGLAGQHRHVETVAGLPKVQHFQLISAPKTQGLGFVADMPALRSLTLMLGGRNRMEDLRHERLEDLSIIRVQGLESLGSLTRFPSLQKLLVEDQLRIGVLDVTGAPLRRLWLVNCKTLHKLEGLATLSQLNNLRVSQTALDLEALENRDWQPSLRFIDLFSTSRKWNNAARERLDARGFRGWHYALGED